LSTWQTTKRAGIACGACGKFGSCTVSPDGTAFKCWRDGGRVHQSAKPAGCNGTGYIGKAHRKPAAASSGENRPSKVYPTADAAIEAAGRSIAGGKLVAVYTYPGDRMRVARFDVEDDDKQFRPVHHTKAGWKIGDPPGPLPLYRGDEIPSDGVVWVFEGEKTADAAGGTGLSAVTSAHGSSATDKSDWTPLAGRDVCILPDNDEPGRKYARAVATILATLQPPARVKILDLPGLPIGGDIVEYIEARLGESAEAIAAEIFRLADAVPWIVLAELICEPWPDPLPLPAGLPGVMLFDFALLPNALHAWIEDISERMQCPPDYCAATAMIVAGSLIGRKVAIRPKRHDDWQVVPNLFGAMVGRPSLLKSPAMKEVLKYLARLEVDAKVEYAKAVTEFEASALVAAATKKVKTAAIKKAVEDGGDAQAIADEIAKGATDEPIRRRYILNDTTVEKCGVILSENPNGVLIFVDELVSFLRSMDREGHEGDRGFYLTAWAGDSRYTYDRIGRGTVDIEAAIVSIVGSIQPGVIADYLRGAVHGGAGDDGLIQRFQLTVWPDASPHWRNVDRYPNADAKAVAQASLARLAELSPTAVDAERDNYDRDALPFLRFDYYAQSDFDKWRADLESQLRSGDEHPAIESHLAKYRSLIPSLALILHLLDGGKGAVTADALAKAIGWGRYLETHARRLYAGVTEAPAVAARQLAGKIQSGVIADNFAARDVYRNGWAGLDRDRTESAIEVLLSPHWLEERIEPTPGKARTRYAINPKILNGCRDGTDKTDKGGVEGAFVSNVSTDPGGIPIFEGSE
jgi:hypothetical protein